MRPVVVPNLRGTGRQGGVWAVLAVLVAAALAASLLLLMMVASPARAAATFTVNSNADTNDGACTTEPDGCTLREAISTANAASGEDKIVFALGQTAEERTITLRFMLPTITDASGLTIDGQIESSSVTISGGGAVGVFRVGSDAKLTLNNLTVANGGGNNGGGIQNSPGGTLTVSNSTLSGNYGGHHGGGITNFGGTLTVSDSTLSGNSAFGGGGIFNQGTATVSNSTLSGNIATETYGGGIDNNSGTLTVSNSTLFGNSAPHYGGGIYNRGTLKVSNSTLSGNSASNKGGGILNPGTATLENTIVANSPSGGNCSSPITDGGYNISSDSSCAFAAEGSRNATDPMLGPLAENGGPTLTHALLAGSPAIDKGNSFDFTTDQRGISRPQGVAADIGAYELVDITAPTVTSTVPENNPTTKVLKTADVTATFSEDVQNVDTTTFKLERVIAAKKSPTKYEPVAATVTPSSGIVEYDANATLNPTQDLPNGTYRVTLTDGVIDTVGNALVPKTWTFKVSK